MASLRNSRTILSVSSCRSFNAVNSSFNCSKSVRNSEMSSNTTLRCCMLRDALLDASCNSDNSVRNSAIDWDNHSMVKCSLVDVGLFVFESVLTSCLKMKTKKNKKSWENHRQSCIFFLWIFCFKKYCLKSNVKCWKIYFAQTFWLKANRTIKRNHSAQILLTSIY